VIALTIKIFSLPRRRTKESVMTDQDQSAHNDQAILGVHHKKSEEVGDKRGSLTPKPPPVVGRWIRSMLAFGVSVAVGLAPLLGSKIVPHFFPLLDLLPEELRDSLIAVTSALMGLVAIGVQWFSGEELDRATRRKTLRRCVAASFLGVLVFYNLTILTVTPVKYGDPKNQSTATFLIGLIRPYKEPCTDRVMSDEACIDKVGLDQSLITGFWGNANVTFSKLALAATYLTFILGFASAVGIVMYPDGGVHAQKADKRARLVRGSTDELLRTETDRNHNSPIP
jgi:hypothetical protein